MADAKSVTEQVEDFELENAKRQQDEETPYPPCLQGVSDDEVKKLGVKTTLKLDLVIMPAMTIMYILNYLGWHCTPATPLSIADPFADRQNIAASKLANIMEDLDMTVTQYNTCVSVLFAGYSM